jgi:hypothetical protein
MTGAIETEEGGPTVQNIKPLYDTTVKIMFDSRKS